jgi:predicted PurR-regulated permease PerM
MATAQMNNRPDPSAIVPPRRKSEEVFWAILLVLSAILAGMIFRFFWRPAIYAAVIGIGFYPVHLKIKKLVPRENPAALISTFLVLSILVLGGVFLASAASGEFMRAARYLNSNAAHTTEILGALLHPADRFNGWLSHYVDLGRSGMSQVIESLPSKLRQFLFSAATAMVAGTASVLAEGVITLFVVFFVFRDGPEAAWRFAAQLPVDQRRVSRLYSQIRNSIFANLYGILAVAAGQGILTGVAFAVLRIPSAVLFGIVAAFCSLIPIVGPALVWVPGSIFLFATGHWLKAVLLLAWGVLVVSTADNIIRPLVIMGRVRYHPLILLFALIGGVKQFGFAGLFIGPVLVSMIIAIVDILRQEFGEPKAEDVARAKSRP